MNELTSVHSSLEEYNSAGRFHPQLHGWIRSALLDYPAERTTVAHVKAMALLRTGANWAWNCNCGDMPDQVRMTCQQLIVTQAELRDMLRISLPDGSTVYPRWEVRAGETRQAIEEAKHEVISPKLCRLAKGCGWGLFLFPGKWLEDVGGGGILNVWKRFSADPVYQCELFMRKFDELLALANGEVEIAASMFVAGNTQPTCSTHGKQFGKTLNRLISGGHRRH